MKLVQNMRTNKQVKLNKSLQNIDGDISNKTKESLIELVSYDKCRSVATKMGY